MNFCVLVKLKRKIILLASVILVTLAITVMIIFTKDINKGNIEFKIDELLDNYYTSYDMTIISNKNINTYNVQEWHEEGIRTKFEYLDYMKNVITIETDNKNCYITNNGNNAKLIIQNLYNNKNIMSLSTFNYIYALVDGNCYCKKNIYSKDKEIIIEILLEMKCNCEASKLANELKISKLELIIVESKPKNYIVYDKNKKEYISIVYNMFENNLDKEEKK